MDEAKLRTIAQLQEFLDATQEIGLLLKAKDKTDLQAAQEMKKSKAELFELFNKSRRKSQACNRFNSDSGQC